MQISNSILNTTLLCERKSKIVYSVSLLVAAVAIAYCSLFMMLFCMKRANKQTNEDGNDRARYVDMKMKIKFVRNNDFEVETDLNKYIFPFLHIPNSLFNRAKFSWKFTFSFRNLFKLRSSVSDDGAGWINKRNSFWWWTKSIRLLFKNVNSVSSPVHNKEWCGQVQWDTLCHKDFHEIGCHVLHISWNTQILYNRMHIILWSTEPTL